MSAPVIDPAGPWAGPRHRDQQPLDAQDRPVRQAGEYAEAGIPLFWRVDRSPELRVHAFVLGRYGYEEVVVLRGRGTCPTPWGEVTLDLDQIRTGGGSG